MTGIIAFFRLWGLNEDGFYRQWKGDLSRQFTSRPSQMALTEGWLFF
jgi:hypothetical protein